MYDLVAVGAGASGITAAIMTAQKGLKCALVDKNDAIGKKILATGNGRCNITNKDLKADRFHSGKSGFTDFALSCFGYEKSVLFFEKLGLKIIQKENGRCYPLSNSAASLNQIFLFHIKYLKIDLFLDTKVSQISKKGDIFHINSHDKSIKAKNILLATGGVAAPHLGCDKSGYEIATSFSHSIIKPLPSLTQLFLDYSDLKRLKGVKQDACVSVYQKDKKIAEKRGDILFTDYGISGSATLDISRAAVVELDKGKEVEISIDLLPDLSVCELRSFLNADVSKDIYTALMGVLSKKISTVLLRELRISPDSLINELSKSSVDSFICLIKSWRFKVSGFRGFRYAETTIGGVSADEVDEKTMMSKKVNGLYFSGEVLDVDGDCGGYNLAWAWASAALVSKSIGAL